MKAELTAASPAEPEERQGIRADVGRRQTAAVRAKGASALGAFVDIVLSNIKLLLLGPLVATAVVFGIVSFLPKWYTSVVYLNLDETGARAADARMRSIPILDKVLAEYKAPQATLEERRAAIEKNRRIEVAPGEIPKTSKLFRMEYSDRDPLVARKINSLLIEAWLESTKPPPDRRALIEADIERADAQAKSMSQLIERLQKDAPSLVTQSSLQGELATPISGLIAKRDEVLATLLTLRNSLNGVSRDVVFGTPDLPEQPSWPKKGITTLLAAAITGLFLLLLVILHRFRPAWV